VESYLILYQIGVFLTLTWFFWRSDRFGFLTAAILALFWPGWLLLSPYFLVKYKIMGYPFDLDSDVFWGEFKVGFVLAAASVILMANAIGVF
jgi:hypothetical protein